MKKQAILVSNSFAVLSYLRTGRLDNRGKAPIYLRITVNGHRSEFSVKRKIKPEKWNSLKGRVKGSSQKVLDLNRYIDDLESKAFAIHSKLVKKKKPFTSEIIKNKLLNKEETYKTILTIYDEHNEQIKELVDLNYSYGAYRRHVRTRNHLKDFIKHEFKREDYFVKEIDLRFINRFQHYLVTKEIGNQNTTTKYLVNFKKIMRIAFANNWVNKDPFIHWKAKWKKVEREVLSELELRNMMKKEFKMKRLEQVRDIFVFCCFTGLAYTDVQKLSKDHIILKMDGTRWIKINRSKTDCRSTIPLLPAAEKIIQKYVDHPITLQNGLLLPVISNQKTNAYLKEIADACNLEKHLTFHLARHTFATTVTLANGIPIESVSKMLGHRSLKTTQIYAKVMDQKLMLEMEKLREKY